LIPTESDAFSCFSLKIRTISRNGNLDCIRTLTLALRHISLWTHRIRDLISSFLATQTLCSFSFRLLSSISFENGSGLTHIDSGAFAATSLFLAVLPEMYCAVIPAGADSDAESGEWTRSGSNEAFKRMTGRSVYCGQSRFEKQKR
jgi:hypothetical protein